MLPTPLASSDHPAPMPLPTDAAPLAAIDRRCRSADSATAVLRGAGFGVAFFARPDADALPEP